MPFATKLKKALSGFMAVVLLLRFFPWYILFLLLLNETVEEESMLRRQQADGSSALHQWVGGSRHAPDFPGEITPLFS
mgnify:CR=1 FL=1